ncbi:Homeodomain-like protein [Artemisia annua]|uniref:Homeodomain-like protein n=1 Tax=Artemisia annua TaxID=35608 RepID=A0A2U1N065_ARTAN|nr:Homeodomain-like protein [Artemisia annua]
MASPSLSSPPTIATSSSMRPSGSQVEPPIRAQATRMGMSCATFSFLPSAPTKDSHQFSPPFITYGRCTNNHLTSTGDGLIRDGCGEFMPLRTANPSDSSFLICDACGCHRSFHRENMSMPLMQPMHQVMNYPYPSRNTHDTPSPPPISSCYYPPPPHMFQVFNPTSLPPPPTTDNNNRPSGSVANQSKHFRSKFTDEKKEKMLEFAIRIGWKILKKDEELVMGFCNELDG